jgi:glycosyltransferase involved in cell wall biosynthesis
VGAIVVRLEENQGKGAALVRGFKEALRRGADVVVTLDADGQHEPAEIPRLVLHLLRTGADVVVGMRMSNLRQMPWIRRFTNRFTSACVSLLCGKRVRDSQSGFRAHRADMLRSIKLVKRKYDMESELLVRVARAGGKIEEVKVSTIYTGEEKSKIHAVRDTWRFFKFLAMWF